MKSNKNDIINKLAQKFIDYTNTNSIAKKPSNYKDPNDLMKTFDRPNVTYDWDKEKHNIMIHFGKNSKGLTDEFITIGKFIEKLSKKAHVYITEAFIDGLDDVYDIKLHYDYK